MQGEYVTAVLLSFTVIVVSLITQAAAAEPDAVRALSDDQALTFAKQLVDDLGSEASVLAVNRSLVYPADGTAGIPACLG